MTADRPTMTDLAEQTAARYRHLAAEARTAVEWRVRTRQAQEADARAARYRAEGQVR